MIFKLTLLLSRVGKATTLLVVKLERRLFQEAKHNVALRVEETDHSEMFRVSGRGELHLSILIETMRREGYEIAISRPEVIVLKKETGNEEPVERLLIDIEEDSSRKNHGRNGSSKSFLRICHQIPVQEFGLILPSPLEVDWL